MMDEDERDSAVRTGRAAAGLSAAGALITGAGALVVAFVATLRGDFVAGGTCLLAAAVAFGLLANAVYRH